MTSVHHYHIHGLKLNFEGRDPDFFRTFESLTADFFTATAPAETDAGLHLSGRSVAAAADLPNPDESDYRIDLTGTPEGGVSMRLLARPPGKLIWLLEDTAVTWCDLERGWAEAVVVRDRWPRWGFQTLIPLLSEWLGRHGMFLLHTGANRLPNRSGCVLFFGASGAGKTTTVLSLAGRGWPMICDDAGFLTTRQGRSLVWGLPRASKVHRLSFDLLPHLDPVAREPISGSDEFRIQFRDLPHISPLQQTPVTALFLIEPRNELEHVIRPVASLTALSRLLQGNMRVIDPAAVGNAGRMFQSLGQLCRTVPCFSLSLGPDLADLPETLEALLNRETVPC